MLAPRGFCLFLQRRFFIDILGIFVFGWIFFVVATVKVHAQTVSTISLLPRSSGIKVELRPTPSPALQGSASSTSAASVAESTASAALRDTITQTIARDPTATGSQIKSELVMYLEQNDPGSLSPKNFLQYALRRAVGKGVPANTLVLLLLFPVTASLIAIFRHVIGLRGFGVYTPAVLAVALLSMGFGTGTLLFGLVFLTTIVGRYVLTRLKLQYLPRTALLIWMVTIVMVCFMLIAPDLSLTNVVSVSIFPLLVLVLLSENFLDAQSMSSFRSVVQLTLETLFLAFVSAIFMRSLTVQEFVIIHPEVTVLVVFVVDILVGRYTGLRVMELLRFKPVLDPEE